jgi:hypothetical protein
MVKELFHQGVIAIINVDPGSNKTPYTWNKTQTWRDNTTVVAGDLNTSVSRTDRTRQNQQRNKNAEKKTVKANQI